MKKIYLILPLMMLCLSAFGTKPQYGSAVSDAAVRKSGDQVVVNFTIDPQGFPKNYKAEFIPVLYNDAGRSKSLEPVTLSKRNKRLSDLRKGLGTDGYIKVSRGRELVAYATVIPFEDWMQTVSLSVRQSGEDCCCRYDSESRAVEDKLLYFNPTPAYSREKLDYNLTELEKYDLDNPFLHPAEDYSRRYDILSNERGKGTSKLTFKAGSAVIDPGFKGNSEVLESIVRALELIRSDPNAVLKKIVIAGYASPEGPLALNTRLAQQRAEAVRNYLRPLVNRGDDIFELYNGREDWDGLREMVVNSDVPEGGKNDILSIIDSYTMEQEIRKTRLMKYSGGGPYRYMLDNFFPELRSGGYVQVYYQIDRRATVATAVTDSRGRTTWIDPDSPENRAVTDINRSIDLMSERKFGEALQLLKPHSNDPITWNALGVCCMMQGDYDKADNWFKKAAANGDTDAVVNLEQTRMVRLVEE